MHSNVWLSRKFWKEGTKFKHEILLLLLFGNQASQTSLELTSSLQHRARAKLRFVIPHSSLFLRFSQQPNGEQME